MKAALKQTYLKLETLKKQVISDFDQLSENQRNWKKDEQTWSLNQVIDHIVISETKSLNYIQKKIQKPEALLKPGFKTKMYGKLLGFVMQSNIKYKARVDIVLPAAGESQNWEDLKTRWNVPRIAMLNLIDEGSMDVLSKLVYKHPIAGRLTYEQCLEFCRTHLMHHMKQIDRIKAETNFPKS